MKEKLTILDLFAGIGGMSKAFVDAEFDVALAIERDEATSKLYKNIVKIDNIITGDAFKLNIKDIMDIDVVAGGFPCQGFSKENQYRTSEDNRFISLFIKIIEQKRPKAILFETSSIILKIDSMSEQFKKLRLQMENLNYRLYFRAIKSYELVGLPIDENKLYIVGIRKDVEVNAYNFPEDVKPLLKFSDIFQLSQKVDDYYYKIHIEKYNNENIVKNKVYYPRKNILIEKSLYPINMLFESYIKDDFGVRKLTRNELAILKGLYEHNFNESKNKSQIYKVIRNASNTFVVRELANEIRKSLGFEKIEFNKVDLNYFETFLRYSEKKEINKEINKEERLNQNTNYDKQVEILNQNANAVETQIGLINNDPEVGSHWKRMIENVDNPNITKNEKGKALEILMMEFFQSIEGFICTSNIRTSTEEIDIEIYNEGKIFRTDEIILAECKNWNNSVGRNQLDNLDTKIRNRNGRCKLGFMVAWNGVCDTIDQELLRYSRSSEMIIILTKNDIISAIEENNIVKCLRDSYMKALNK